jgi:hypothetical protein
MNTGAGMAGNISGNIAMLAPLAVIPGGATVGGAAALGATAGGLQPSTSAGERLTNMGVGGALSGGTQALAGPIARRVGEAAAGRQAQAAQAQSQNKVRDETIQRGQQAGYAVPPSAIQKPSFIGGRLESLGGKAALGQEASLRNQPVTDTLAREAASLRPEQAISKTALRQSRHDLAAPHREIAAISQLASQDLAALQQARFDSKMAWKEFQRQGNRNAFDDATKAGKEIKRLESALEGHAVSAGRPDLVEALKVSRSKIAQSHEVQRALNQGTGNVDASVLGRALDSGAPLTGNLETIARYQQAFPTYTREASKVPSPGVGKTELLAAALLGGGGMAGTDSPYGAIAGIAPFLSGPARAALLSRPVQQRLANPSYSSGAVTRGAAQLSDPETRRRAALLARALVVPTIPQAVNQ